MFTWPSAKWVIDLNQTIAAERKPRAFVYVVSLVAAAGSFSWSYSIILMSGSILYLKSYFHFSQLGITFFSHPISPGWIEGLAMTTGFWGTVGGMLMGSPLANAIGRRRALILAGVLQLLGAFGTSFSSSLVIWNSFRLLTGLGGGLAVLVAPMYVSEIAPAERRGLFVTFNQMAIVIGAFASNLCTFIIAKYLGPNLECWRWMFASQAVPMIIFLAGLFFVPETPRWLLMKGRRKEAHSVLIEVGGSDYAALTIQEIEERPEIDDRKIRHFLRPAVRVATLIAVGLEVFDQWVGVPTLVLYAPSLFVHAGVSSNSAAIANTVILRIGDMFSTLFVVFCVDKFGRRPLLLIGVLGTGIAELFLGLCFYHNAGHNVILATFLVCEIMYNASLPPVAWLITTEIFRTRLRAGGMAIHGSVRYCSSLILAQAFPPMLDLFRVHFGSEGGVFCFFSIICLITFCFSFLLVPETKGKTLEEISARYNVDA
jgi:sugar porter (SP) family MFS transporter